MTTLHIKAAKQRAIAVINTPGVLTDATADLTMLLLLGAARRAHEGETLIREGKWTEIKEVAEFLQECRLVGNC